MKKLLYSFLLLGVALFSACTDEDQTMISQNPESPVLTTPADAAAFVFEREQAEDEFEISWNASNYGVATAVQYDVQLAETGTEFADIINLGTVISETSLVMPVAEINKKIYNKYESTDARVFDLRVISTIGSNNAALLVDTLYTSVQTLSIEPYSTEVVYPSLFLPGGYQAASGYTNDWSPADAPEVYSIQNNDIYEGYIFFANASSEFKFTDEPNWDTNWGDDGADGTLEPGGSNIPVAEAGYYHVKANLNNMTYNLTKTDWGVIGSATPNAWDSDQDMTYNKELRVLTLTVDLVPGEIKFRANDDWAINYGDTDRDGEPELGGENIPIAEAGNYTIVLDLSKAKYKYTLTKN